MGENRGLRTTFKDLVEGVGLRHVAEAAGDGNRKRWIYREGGYEDWKAEFSLVKNGTVILAEILPPPGDLEDRPNESWAEAGQCVHETSPSVYVPFSGSVPGVGEFRTGRLVKRNSVLIAVTTRDKQEIPSGNVASWANLLHSRHGFQTRVIR